MSKIMYYFAFGSNLLESRIHMNNPGAKRYGIGKLDNYQLDFVGFSDRWKGAIATILPKQGKHVWGAIYSITEKEVRSLDKQEGVHLNIYKPLEIQIKMSDGTSKTCRTYQSLKPGEPSNDLSRLPKERQPSRIYLSTIIRGAKESGLPADYIKQLEDISHNCYNGDVSWTLEQ